jgi:tRNA1(Val) A37 N6-methylase TrmN6
VTAWVASTRQRANKEKQVKYLDLGTGNASVLQMVTWALLRDGCQVSATGVEARSEAVGLARRSLFFNLGIPTNIKVTNNPPVANIVHGDFRDVPLELNAYDLVSGTPPYFRVDFTVNHTQDIVSQAIIQQGGMPTSKQSAPARCEFRGGIEAYCAVAAKVLVKDSGRFVVCENWLNHGRVLAAAKEHQLSILEQVNVMGREGKDTLFCVYVMKCASALDTSHDVVVQNLAVRTTTGDWTKDYKELVLRGMSIPC